MSEATQLLMQSWKCQLCLRFSFWFFCAESRSERSWHLILKLPLWYSCISLNWILHTLKRASVLHWSFCGKMCLIKKFTLFFPLNSFCLYQILHKQNPKHHIPLKIFSPSQILYFYSWLLIPVQMFYEELNVQSVEADKVRLQNTDSFCSCFCSASLRPFRVYKNTLYPVLLWLNSCSLCTSGKYCPVTWQESPLVITPSLPGALANHASPRCRSPRTTPCTTTTSVFAI